MTNHLIPLVLFGIALLFLGLRMKTKEKRDFIISMFFVVLGSGYAMFTISLSTLTFFFVAIILSFIGDLLMAEWLKITEHRTVDGIMAFGLAHLVYIFAFRQLNIGGLTLRTDWWLILLGIIISVALFQKVANREDLHVAIKVSNAIYAIIIASLLVFVLAFVFTATTPWIVRITAGLGVILFVVSDSVLAYNEFQSEIPNAKDIIAVTYVLAQILLQITPVLTFVIS